MKSLNIEDIQKACELIEEDRGNAVDEYMIRKSAEKNRLSYIRLLKLVTYYYNKLGRPYREGDLQRFATFIEKNYNDFQCIMNS